MRQPELALAVPEGVVGVDADGGDTRRPSRPMARAASPN
jgi:hypothetical protein